MLVQEYKESWMEDFNKIKKVINEALINLNVSIEHIGSTSITGLAAKPIIDIDIVFGKHIEFDEIRMRLEKKGYYHNGNQGISNREVFKRGKAAVKYDVLDDIVHHLYVCPEDSEELQRHILFRDYLKANEAAKIQYQNLKYDIAKKADQDRKKYAELKEGRSGYFINKIIAKAKENKH